MHAHAPVPRTWPEGRPEVTRTFAAERGDLGEGIVAAVALAADDSGLAGALARVHVAGPAVGAMWKAVTRQAGVLVRGPVVILLQTREAARGTPDARGCLSPGTGFRSYARVPGRLRAPRATRPRPHPWATLPGHPQAMPKGWCILQKSTLLPSVSKYLSQPPAYLSQKGPGIQVECGDEDGPGRGFWEILQSQKLSKHGHWADQGDGQEHGLPMRKGQGSRSSSLATPPRRVTRAPRPR